MNKVQINNIHRQILKMVYSGKLQQAVALIKSQNIINQNDASSPLQMVEETYKLMLKYTIEGMHDPNRDAIYRQLQVSLIMMADTVRNAQYRRYVPNEIFNQSHKDMPASLNSDDDVSAWFHYVLRADSLPSQAEQSLMDACNNDSLPFTSKCLLVSCLTLSCLLCFDIRKYRLMAQFYLKGEAQVWQRAIVGIAVVSYFFNKRLRLYPEADVIVKSLISDPKFMQRYQATIIQLIRAIDTDKITKKLNEEIIPQVSSLPGIKNKMKSDSLSIDNLDDKNPDWHEYIEENKELFDKLADVSKLQMEGGDVFLNTFAQLKNYDFFRKIENWFMPFTTSNKVIKDLQAQFGNGGFNYAKFAESLISAPFICNSDKFSFCLSIVMMPESQRNTFGKYLNSGLGEMAEVTKEDQLLHREEFSYKYLVQYIQDLYRFFKLNILGREFIDIFDKGFSPSGTILFDRTFSSAKEKRKVGEFFFSSDYYRQAFDIFKQISTEAPNFEIFQKMGYSAQKAGDIELALDSYLKAQLYESDQPWNLKKVGWCYRKLKNPAKALEFYRMAEAKEPDNLSISTSIGRCLLEMENYEEALKYYFKVEFLDEKNTKVFRPIAWCCYEVGKYEQSLKYCKRIPEGELIPEDLVLAGHICRMMGNVRDAVDYYRKAISMKDFDIQKLEDAIISDYKPEGKSDLEQENNLLLDYIQYQI
ncbi:MAG: tetratricopeptide repeat protein [Bacteroidales bacterium]|nr:tetratricopeptide repeat protein [Bacteroidales bacterium]